MNALTDEQKARIADIERRFPNYEQAEGWFEPALSIAWALALVHELAAKLERAEQQLAAVTAALTAAHDVVQTIGRERDELKRDLQQTDRMVKEQDETLLELRREMEQLTREHGIANDSAAGFAGEADRMKILAEKAEAALSAIRAEMEVAEDYPAHYWRELAQKAEAERDALRAALEFYTTRDDDGHKARTELARLKGEKGGT